MQFTAAVILAVAAVASAAKGPGIKDLPNCAQHCVADAVKGHTDCGEDALECICEKADTLAVQSADCVVESCGTGYQVLPKGLQVCIAHAKHKNSARQIECVPVQVATQTSAQVVTTTVGPRPTSSVVTAGAAAVGPAGGIAALAVAAALL
ncbi:hypothetical protein L249_1824 [Ophiocordyceps polyrhachis-furcata BCC 54312]|uniref:CFEM domain-containing protein n=1 Tax=Ophiocordyceps polyrhachis-furcata BCC 54312 TaxID=1330021 RepID=A0A367LRK0_9HYPO|nr:hypothetical protein L249_1824 [Ophiocordyceps polyrhachis-furcata BCC 54312]